MSVTAEELTGLSEQEQAALADDAGDDAPETAEATEAGPESASTEPSVAEADSSDEPAAEAEESAEPAPVEPFTPRYEAEPVADYDEQMAKLAESKKALRTKYQDGDLDLDEYEDQREQIETQAQALREANLKATLAQEQAQQTAAQRWQWEQDRFFAQQRDELYKDAPDMLAALDANIKMLAADATYNGKPMNWFLEEADRRVRSRFQQLAPQDTKQKPTASKAKPEVPPNLGDLPAADVAETGGDEFAHLDKLDGMALEAELAKLSKADQDRYLRGG